MLAALVAGLLAATAPFQAEETAPGSHPGVVVLVATPLRVPGVALPRVPGTRVVLSLGQAAPGEAGPVEPQSGAGDAAQTFDVRAASETTAADRSIAEALRAAGDVELRAGAWLDWTKAAHDGRHERLWTRALREAHARGARVVAAGGAAAWVSRWTVMPRDVVLRPSTDPHDTSLDVAVEGLGLFDGALVGVLEAGAPTADRVVERALTYGAREVLLLEGEVALAWDPHARRATIHGPGTVAWIGLLDGSRSRRSVRAARATVLSDGDALDARRGTVVDGQPVEPRRLGSALPFGPLALRRGLAGEAGAEKADAAAWIQDARAALDERTLRRPGGGWSGVVLDLEVRAP